MTDSPYGSRDPKWTRLNGEDKAKLLFEELKADPEAWAAYQRIKAIGAFRADRADIAKVIPYIPEFRESLERARNAIAEGRTIPLEELIRRLDEESIQDN